MPTLFLDQIRADIEAKKAELNPLLAPVNPETEETRELTEEEETRANTLITAIEAGQARLAKLERINTERPALEQPTPRSAPAVHTKKHQYSYSRAFTEFKPGYSLTGLEGEVEKEITNMRGRRAAGMWVPTGANEEVRELMGVREETRSLDATTGAGIIFNPSGGTIIDYLRPQLRMRAMGATFREGVVGQYSEARKTAITSARPVVAGTDTAETNLNFDQITFTPHVREIIGSIRPDVRYASSVRADEEYKQDLAQSMAQDLDFLPMLGAGGVEPTGIFNRSDIQANALSLGTNGGHLSWQTVLALENAVSMKNANRGRMGYLVTSPIRMYGKQASKTSAGYPSFVFENPLPGAVADGSINSYNAYVSNLLSTTGTKGTGTNLSQMAFGNFEDVYIVLWEGVDVLPDPYTGRSQGILKLSSLYACDVQVGHPQSFCVVNDVDTTLPTS